MGQQLLSDIRIEPALSVDRMPQLYLFQHVDQHIVGSCLVGIQVEADGSADEIGLLWDHDHLGTDLLAFQS